MYQFISVDREDEIAVITLRRPERLNAWHAPMRAELTNALTTLGNEPAVHALILTGAGNRAFSAGQDLAETEQFTEDDIVDWQDQWQALYGAIRSLEKPIIAALNGIAAGSAFQVALLCDIRVGHAETKMGQTEINAGIPSVLGPWIMLEMLGRSRTVELVLTGRLMNGAECAQAGLLHYLVPANEVLPVAKQIARELASKPPIAMRLNKRRFRAINERDFQEAISAAKVIESEAFASREPQGMMGRFFAEREARGSQKR